MPSESSWRPLHAALPSMVLCGRSCLPVVLPCWLDLGVRVTQQGHNGQASQQVLSTACATVLPCRDPQSLTNGPAWRRWQRTLLRTRWAWAAVAAAWVAAVVAWAKELAAVAWGEAWARAALEVSPPPLFLCVLRA